MKKKSIIALIVAAALLLGLGVTVFAYDSSEDPIVSLSYLTDIFKPLILRELDNKVDAKVAEAVKNLNVNPTAQQPETPPAQTTEPTGYVVVEMTVGDALYASDACDIMLRAGNAVCIAPDANQGIADYTDATEIMNGESLVKNHMCLIPRGDGRGVLATSESVFIMVRGNYTIVNH